ncbi:glycosyltransferase [Sinomonas sp. ASV486]|uniref:glycosyltransferase n=1 Tax=Sinomonas sp. ASV486 TaxID=3051170 RepID=UPI0027DDE567|nr:glycosyltransferase [Sinomonas sp. ASV486]MDQ4488841.1 glycosyltransferase [Sinomonas sp. ASV486]
MAGDSTVHDGAASRSAAPLAPPIALWAVPVPELGGVARHVLDTAAVGLPGWRLVVLCPEGALAEKLREAGAAVITGPFGPAAGFAASVRTLRRNIRALRPAVVHAHLAYADVISAVATIGTGAKYVTTEHGIAGEDAVYHGSAWKSRLMAAVHSLRLRRASGVIAVSEATKRAMLAKWRPRQAVVVIPNGVDVEEVRARLRETAPAGAAAAGSASVGHGPRVLSLSRLSGEKRIPELLAAFAELRRAHPDATLTVAGEGPDRADLEARARELGLESVVSFPGFVDAGAAMGAADVVVQLSVWENCSYTLLDAVAAGLGVVATPVGGNPEILPERCLVAAEHSAAVAAAIALQADADKRPESVWVTRAEMAWRTVGVYEEAM